MQIPVSKNSLASALTALGKLVSRTSLIKMYQAIQIEGKANMLYFRTRNVTEEIEFRLFADLDEDFPATLVEFEQFRLAVRNCKNKSLKLAIDNGKISHKPRTPAGCRSREHESPHARSIRHSIFRCPERHQSRRRLYPEMSFPHSPSSSKVGKAWNEKSLATMLSW